MCLRLRPRLVREVILALLAAASPAAGAAPDLFPEAVPLSSGELAHLRGGFSRDGVRFDFGIERVVLANGVIETQTLFRSGSRTFQAGAVGSSPLPNPPLTIQNRLDHQQMRILTTVNVRIGNLQAVRTGAIEAARAIPSALPRH